MKKYAIVFLLGSTMIWSSCGQNSKNSPEPDALFTKEITLEGIPSENDLRADISKTNNLSITTSATNEETKTTLSEQKKIIRSGKLSIESKDIAKTKKRIDEQLKALGGYYELENTSSISNYSTYNLDIRIPSKKFDTFLENMESGNDKITEKSIQSKDITLQYIDLESRVKSKKAYLERY